MNVEEETTGVEQSVEPGVDPSSIAYTVEIRLVDEGYASACPAQEDVADQHITVVGHGGEQATEVPIEVITEPSNEMTMHDHQNLTTEQMDSGMMVTFSDSNQEASLHNITVTSDMMTYLPEAGVAQPITVEEKDHHQIIMTQAPNIHVSDISNVKLVDTMSSDPSQMPVLLLPAEAQEQDSTQPGHHSVDTQQDTIKEMEIALEALTGLASTFNAWAQQNPQALGETLQQPQPENAHKFKLGKHKSDRHKSKKHKLGKHKKKSSCKKAKMDSLYLEGDGTATDLFKCKTCGKIFPTRLKLKNHMISHSDERPYTCEVCGSAFKRARYLQIHKKSHFADTLFACQYCDKAYFEKKRLRSHEKCHTNPLTCQICGKAYGDKRGLVIHYRTHTNEKPFICRICGRAFTSKAGVTKHERSHSGLKPYVCKICNKAYTQPTNLSDHERTHINERTFACTSCPKVFLARSSLRRHRVKHHPGEKPNVGKLEPLHSRKRIIKVVTPPVGGEEGSDKTHYKYACSVCEKKFRKEKYLKKHSKLHTAGTKVCAYCNKSFRDKRDLLNHERRHTGEKPFKCSKCGKAFVSSSAMLRHEKCHLGLKPFICPTCGKSFTRTTGLRDHQLIHKGKNKRFPCLHCNKIFASRSALRSHERLKHQSPQVTTMEVPVETEEGDTVSYIKLMFTES